MSIQASAGGQSLSRTQRPKLEPPRVKMTVPKLA